MKIEKPQLFTRRLVQNANLQRTRNEVGDAEQTTGQTDQVGLSEKARLMSQVKKTLLKSDDVRVDKVEYYRNLIEQGDFVVRPDQVAEQMLDEFL